jgi:hypothetical protein
VTAIYEKGKLKDHHNTQVLLWTRGMLVVAWITWISTYFKSNQDEKEKSEKPMFSKLKSPPQLAARHIYPKTR